jgi:ABC-2 type transport system permease protein
MTGWQMLFLQGVLRFWKVGFPDGGGPGAHRHDVPADLRPCAGRPRQGVRQLSYTAFLVPGLVMMSVLQNAFANSSSSLIQSKIMGNLVFLLLTPLSHWSWFVAYVGRPSCAGLVVGLGVCWWPPGFHRSPAWCAAVDLVFAVWARP